MSANKIEAFAKVFDYEGGGQIIAQLEENEDKTSEQVAGVKIYFSPINLGICSMFLGFDSWGKAISAYDNLTAEIAMSYISETVLSFVPDE